MAVIVLHKETGKHYVLLGTGYGAYKSARPSFIGGNLLPKEEEGEIPVAAVSDQSGNVEWFLTEKLQVIEIDGMKPAKLLNNFVDKDLSGENITIPNNVEQCPACGQIVSIEEIECPSCGLTLIVTEE